MRGPAQTRLPWPRPWALGFRRLEGLVLVSPRCVDGDPNRKGRRRLGGACPPAAPRGWHRRLLPAGALGPQAHPGGRVELWLVESRVVGGWFSFLDVAVMLPCRLGGRVGRGGQTITRQNVAKSWTWEGRWVLGAGLSLLSRECSAWCASRSWEAGDRCSLWAFARCYGCRGTHWCGGVQAATGRSGGLQGEAGGWRPR